MAARSRRHLVRWLAAVAVLVVVVVGSVAVVRNNNTHSTNAADRREPAAETPSSDSSLSTQAQGKSVAPDATSGAGASNDTSTPSAASTASGLGVALGDFGDLSKAAARRRALAAIDAAGLAASPSTFAGASESSGCPSEQLAPVLATATGTYHGRPAEIVVTERTGTRHVLLLIADPCEVKQLR